MNSEKDAALIERSFVSRAVFYGLTDLLLVGFGWLAGWWLKGHSFSAYAQSDYFSDPFRIFFLVYIFLEHLVDYLVSPRWIRPMDEVPHEWLHWRARMWETVLVVAAFSDCLDILPVSSTPAARGVGAALLAAGLFLYILALLERGKELKEVPQPPFPVKGIFRVIRFPETLSAVIASFGVALLFNSWAGVFCAVITVGIMIGFINAQDRMMLQKYGSPWAHYQLLVRKWIPCVW